MKSTPAGHYLQPDPKVQGTSAAVTTCFTSGVSKEHGERAGLGLCFLPGILMLGWVENEPKNIMDREPSLCFSKENVAKR